MDEKRQAALERLAMELFATMEGKDPTGDFDFEKSKLENWRELSCKSYYMQIVQSFLAQKDDIMTCLGSSPSDNDISRR